MFNVFKSLMEVISKREYINFAVLGLPQSGKTEFICTIRGEKNETDQTRYEGEKLSRKVVSIAGKTLVYEKGLDISGLNLSDYETLCQKADIIYFFFKADDFLLNRSLDDINKQSNEELFDEEVRKKAGDYQTLVGQYLGSVVMDKNAQNKPIKIIASFKDRLPVYYRRKNEVKIKNEIQKILNKQELPISDNCLFYLADLQHDKEWVENNAFELIFNQK